MARTNRNNRMDHEVKYDDSERRLIYKTAIYARLSVEDNGIDSESIENQLYQLNQYVAAQKDLELISVRCDNGFTGTNFERPEFMKMIDEIKKGTINCIVVKDLSRFGRNYLEAGNYLEHIFPYLGVRFIAINDHYDSKSAGSNESLILALKNVYHHTYAKDISRKICTLFDVKKKKGLFMGRFAPYGYKKSASNRYVLEIDEETAPVIRDIFKWRLAGMGVVSIARKLNDLGIKSQCRRLYEQGLLKGTNHEAESLWSAGSVLGVLENPNYYGCIVERKTDNAYYRGTKQRVLPKEEWNYIEGTHEAIIDKADFKAVQELIQRSKEKRKKQIRKERKRTENILQGLIVCGTCGKKMVRDGGYYDEQGNLIRHRFGCQAKYKRQDNCTAATIPEEQLIRMIFHSLKAWISQFANREKLRQSYLESDAFRHIREEHQNRLSKAERELAKVRQNLMDLYSDYKEGLLSKEGYLYAQSQYEEKQEMLERQIQLARQGLEAKTLSEQNPELVDKLLAFRDATVLTREMCETLIKKVIIYESHVELVYTFRDELERMYQNVKGGMQYGA